MGKKLPVSCGTASPSVPNIAVPAAGSARLSIQKQALLLPYTA